MPYDVGADPYTDPQTGVLYNRLGLQSQDELDTAEAQITAINISRLTMMPVLAGPVYDVDSLRYIHKKLFEQIYDWAGDFRTVELHKDTTSFGRVEHLLASAQQLFRELSVDKVLTSSSELSEVVERLAYYYGGLNVLHAFREGNGRTNRTFLGIVADNLGYHIAWDKMDPAENIAASVASYHGDDKLLQKMFTAIAEPIS